jgi:hypothetical protein
MMFGQEVLGKHHRQRDAGDAREHDGGNRQRTHGFFVFDFVVEWFRWPTAGAEDPDPP